MRGSVPALVLLLALLAPEPGWAQAEGNSADDNEAEGDDEAGDDDDSAADDDPVPDDVPGPSVHETVEITATGQPRLLSRSPLPVRQIDAEAIRKTTAADAAELLSRAPGVPVMAQGVDQRGGVAGLSMQGVPAGRTLILLDGRPLLGDTGGIVDLGQIPVALLERVEIVEGPMSALYGSEALGGVVNLVGRAPTDRLGAEARLQLGTDRSADGSAAGWGGRRGFGFAAVGTLRRRAAQDLVPSDPATDLDARTSGGARLMLRYRRGWSDLNLDLLYGHDVRTGVVDRTNAALDLPEIYDSPKTNDRVRGALSQRLAVADGLAVRWSLETTGFHTSFAESLRESPVTRDRRSNLFALSGQVRADLFLLPWLSGTAGVDGRGERLRIVQDKRLPGGDSTRLVEVPQEQAGSLEPWAQGDLRLLDDRLEFVGGVRLSVHDAYGVTAAPSLAIRGTLWPGATVRVSGGRGYRAPSLKDRYLVFDHSALGYVVLGRPDLQPESSWGLNGSFEQRFGAIASVRVGGFAHRIENRIVHVLDPDAPEELRGLNVFRTSNVGGARSLGAQFTGELNLTWLRATAAYRLLQAVDDSGFALPDAPMHGVRGTVEGRIEPIHLSIYTAVGYESERFVDSGQRQVSPGMVRWDARLSGRIPGKQELSIWVGVDNILDQHRDPSDPADFRPVDRRRFVGGVRGRIDGPRPGARPGGDR